MRVTRRVIDVPPEEPVVLMLTPTIAQLPGRIAHTVEEALQMAAEKAANPNRKPISHYFGILSPETYGGGVAYQRAIRDE